MPPKWCNYKLFWGHHHIFAKPILAVSKCLTATVAILQALNWTWPETTLAPQVWPRCRKSPETLVQVSHFVFHAFFFFLSTQSHFYDWLQEVLFPQVKIWDMVYDASVQDETFAQKRWSSFRFHSSLRELVEQLPPECFFLPSMLSQAGHSEQLSAAA